MDNLESSKRKWKKYKVNTKNGRMETLEKKSYDQGDSQIQQEINQEGKDVQYHNGQCLAIEDRGGSLRVHTCQSNKVFSTGWLSHVSIPVKMQK